MWLSIDMAAESIGPNKTYHLSHLAIAIKNISVFMFMKQPYSQMSLTDIC